MVRGVALCVSMALAGTACAATGDADLTTGPGITTTTTAVPTTTTTTAPPPTTAPRPTDAPPSSPDTTEATTTTTAPTTTTTTRPPVLSGPVTYSITGGIAGVSDRLTIGPAGAATFQSASKTINFNVARAQLMRLAVALDEAAFPTLRSVYGFAAPDGFEYRVAYDGKTVLIFGSAGPARLEPALEILGQEMERARTL